jgi:hypothetical protein
MCNRESITDSREHAGKVGASRKGGVQKMIDEDIA